VPDLAGFFRNKDMVYIAIGIIGATVMPHNLYLHSALVQSRRLQADAQSKPPPLPNRANKSFQQICARKPLFKRIFAWKAYCK